VGRVGDNVDPDPEAEVVVLVDPDLEGASDRIRLLALTAYFVNNSFSLVHPYKRNAHEQQL
jgi:hypothetical protein